MSSLQRIIWLASYPKSGNTWIRSALASYFQPPGGDLDINALLNFAATDVGQAFFDRANGRPFRGRTPDDWIRLRPQAMRLLAASKEGHHFVKTHCQVMTLGAVPLIQPEVTAAAVYILRNPFDIAPSYARHLTEDIDGVIDRMTHRNAGQGTASGIMEIVGRWDKHIRSWTEAPGLVLHVMRYEDMVADPEAAFRGLPGFLKVPVDEPRLARTLERTSFDALRKRERERGFRERPPKMERFFARGTAGGWREDLSPAQVARLRSAFEPALKRWYPELLAETEAFARTA